MGGIGIRRNIADVRDSECNCINKQKCRNEGRERLGENLYYYKK